MFVYFNYRKNGGLINHTAFNEEEKISSFLLEELKNLAQRNAEDYTVLKPSLKDLEKYFSSLKSPKIPQLREAISRYEEWASPHIGSAIFHNIKELSIIKDTVL